ncbi:hypothetical protein MTR62_16225 [Novosphingobium sp. 1949]|uniref:Uncharacterized protein n=1 Tax=Novosphingobium organovorum TaxID=2930092 RepID=A0ABT0BGN1_9SPHN|nr:hypothetical protein [Novosphingobium organovorum]MCJ2184227.1 hypothetical protein [Novosphingobium organovorum]
MSRARIAASTAPAFDALAARLLERAQRQASALAETRAEIRKASARDADAPWRRADLLWPQFTKG